MGRPPCCDKISVKKGPWTPEEDIILVSYIQEHGPGNWRSVPTNTGLLRCSKSCRLRWTNYLRPGIKRGNFTDHEEKMIIHLQALLGNSFIYTSRWAAIASYVPQRTDNDIKNYWNIHLKKKLKKLQINEEEVSNKGQWERRLQTDIHMAKQALCEALSLDKTTSKQPYNSYHEVSGSNSSIYASSAENISKLLQNWMKIPPSSNSETNSSATTPEGFDSLFTFNSNCHSSDACQSVSVDTANLTPETSLFQDETKPILETQVPLTLLEKWLFEDGVAHEGQEDLINMSLEDSAAGFF
ncbi:hypothetical protein Dsin_005828 [Dipteronia sinensis]|uniref:Uncharacterized protein n=1 Tax=Dipteronia sinensis TaxID=43782 RepID=A0AAE0EF25_9ROSI|nr:hypothetical protein Dsin_005828 [Dipteronia sinensis]